MTKKLLSLLLAAMLCAACVISAAVVAANSTDDLTIVLQIDNPVMSVNGQEKEIDPGMGTAPVILNDRTLLPVRAVVEEMGGGAEWNGDMREVTLTCGEDTIRLVIDDTTAYLNGEAKALDTAPVIINGRTMLPIRFIAESFGFDVDWDNAEKAVTVSRKPSSKPDTEKPSASGNDANILIAYFTVPETDGVDAVSSASRVVDDGEVVGNVEFIARTIREETGGDLFKIETVRQYPGTHQELLEFAAAETDRNERPELKTRLDEPDAYDVIFLGFPIWNADLPMPVYTFLDEYDLSGKTIIPFTAHGGSGFAGTVRAIARQEPNAQVETNGFSVSRSSVAEAKDDIISWVQTFGFARADAEDTDSSNILIAYFSHTGNTKEVAEYIAGKTGGDLFRIEAKEPYSGGTAAVAERAKSEEEQNARPEIAATVSNMERYDTIFIGYPIWYYNAPMVIGTFLESYDLSGKTLIPFCTSSSSDIEVSMDLINSAGKGATVSEGITANGGNDETDAWLDKLGIK